MQTEETQMPKDKKPQDIKAAESAAQASKETAGDSDENQASDQGMDFQQLVAQAEKSRDEYKDKYLRLAADMENLRRRTDREKTELLQYGLEKLLKDLLPVLDSFDKALPEIPEGQAQEGDNQSMLSGLVLVKKQLNDVLTRYGLEPIVAAGKPFDPNLHQAIQRIDSDVETETVAVEFARGYTLNGRLVRPAMVSVFVPKSDDAGSDN